MITALRTPAANLAFALALSPLTASCSDTAPAAGESATAGLPSELEDVEVVRLPDATVGADASTSEGTASDGSDPDLADSGVSDMGAGDTGPDPGDAADASSCATDAECEDGNPCNGQETCQAGSCVAGTQLADQTGVCFPDQSAGVCVGGGVTDRGSCTAACNTATGACVEDRTLVLGGNGADAGKCVDTSFDDDSPNRNDNAGIDANGHRLTSDSFIWLRFDLAALPAGATVTDARLDLYSAWTDPGSGGARPTVVNLGANTVPATQWRDTEATWNTYDGTNAWTGGQDGGTGDRGAELARIDVDPNPVDLYLEFPLAAAVTGAVEAAAGSGSLVLNVWGAGSGHDRQYIACEGADGQRPALRVDYTW